MQSTLAEKARAAAEAAAKRNAESDGVVHRKAPHSGTVKAPAVPREIRARVEKQDEKIIKRATKADKVRAPATDPLRVRCFSCPRCLSPIVRVLLDACVQAVAAAEEEKPNIPPWVVYFLIFVVVGSAVFQVIQAAMGKPLV